MIGQQIVERIAVEFIGRGNLVDLRHRKSIDAHLATGYQPIAPATNREAGPSNRIDSADFSRERDGLHRSQAVVLESFSGRALDTDSQTGGFSGEGGGKETERVNLIPGIGKSLLVGVTAGGEIHSLIPLIHEHFAQMENMQFSR